MSVNEKMTAIADRLRGYGQKAEKFSLDEMAMEIDRAFTAGVQVGKTLEAGHAEDVDWNVFQANGTRTDYSQAFIGGYFDDSTFKPEYKLNVTNAYRMFQSAVNITDLSKVEMDFSQCVDFAVTFGGMAGLTKIGDISTVSADEVYRPFLGCSALVEVGTFTVKETTTFNHPFARCEALEEITFAGVIGQDLDMSYSPLNKASIESIMDCLSETASGKTVTLKSGQVDVAFETSEGAADGREVFESLIAEKPNWVFSY